MSRPLSSFTVRGLDRLPNGTRFVNPDLPPDQREMWALVKGPGRMWSRPYPPDLPRGPAYTSADIPTRCGPYVRVKS